MKRELRKKTVRRTKNGGGGLLGKRLKGVVDSTRGVDIQFLVAVYILLAFGLLMVLSASSPIAYASKATNHDSFFYFKKQLLWAIFGSIGMFITANFDYHKLTLHCAVIGKHLNLLNIVKLMKLCDNLIFCVFIA